MITNSFSFLGVSVANALQAAGADISALDHILSITGCPSMDYRKIKSTPGFLAAVAETPGVVTYTPIAANSTTYTLIVQQYVPSLGKIVNRNLTYQTATAGDTATTICNAFRAQLVAYTDLQITGTGAATLIMTADAGSPIFTVVNNEPVNSTVVVNTPGVRSRGTYDDTVAVGATGGVVGQVYSQITINWIYEGGETNGMPNYSINRHTLFVNEADANFAAFAARIVEVVHGFGAGVTTSDPELIAIGS